ncbi:MAG: urate hydroxylase PuuD [Ramlibacter sp.]
MSPPQLLAICTGFTGRATSTPAERLCAVHGVLPLERQHLPDRQVAHGLGACSAIGVALAFLVVFWLLYDAICRLFGQKKNGDAIVGALVLALVCAASWLACHWFAGRAAFLLVGAMIATAMSANVLLDHSGHEGHCLHQGR